MCLLCHAAITAAQDCCGYLTLLLCYTATVHGYLGVHHLHSQQQQSATRSQSGRVAWFRPSCPVYCVRSNVWRCSGMTTCTMLLCVTNAFPQGMFPRALPGDVCDAAVEGTPLTCPTKRAFPSSVLSTGTLLLLTSICDSSVVDLTSSPLLLCSSYLFLAIPLFALHPIAISHSILLRATDNHPLFG
jgi:hypothetical protein